jgi:superfamily II DNA or RNA helicase
VTKEANLSPLGILNPELLKARSGLYLAKGSRQNEYLWKSNVRYLIVDECHRFSGAKTQNAWVLAAAKRHTIKVLCLSATIAESPLKMRAVGFLLGLHHWRDFWDWALRHGCYRNYWNGIEFTRSPKTRDEVLGRLHAEIFPRLGVRQRIRDIPGFPESEIIVESYELSDKSTAKIKEAYAEAFETIQTSPRSSPLTVLLRARQQSELYKIDLLADMTEDLLDEGKSVAIFTAFRESQRLLRVELETRLKVPIGCLINGDQTMEERTASIDAFQANRERVILVMIQAGGVSLSLDDTTGAFPRVALLCPTFSAVEMKQALGRIHRASGKSKSIQRVIFAAKTVEEQVCEIMKRKIENLELLNDGDLQGTINWKGE